MTAHLRSRLLFRLSRGVGFVYRQESTIGFVSLLERGRSLQSALQNGGHVKANGRRSVSACGGPRRQPNRTFEQLVGTGAARYNDTGTTP